MTLNNDLICALATPNGMGALAVIRLSGKGSWDCAERFFSRTLADKPSHTVHYGNMTHASGEVIDEVVLTLFAEHRSFTGEESVEITCHGSTYIQQQLLTLFIDNGCRMASPGEFTQRAFMNGRMDLSQAEAVSDLISAQTRMAHAVALKQLRGGFSSELKTLREKLIHFASLVELELDFAEEDVEFADRTELKALLSEVLTYISRLIRSFELGNALKDGVPVAIVGAPNTGKSTLLNQLLGEDRALVSNIAGTTRDVIEETINLGGILFRLIDTAGIRENADVIEAMGIERTHEKISKASLVLCMADLSVAGSLEEVSRWAENLRVQHTDKHVLVVGNKKDLAAERIHDGSGVLPISAQSGEGMDALRNWLVQTVQGDYDVQSETIVSNLRHAEALKRTQTALSSALHGLETGISADFVAMDIRQAMFDLGSITGDISTEDLLGNIFSKFCIGK
jgi:tRNA modification GTPase